MIPRGGGWNRFDLLKNREEIKLNIKTKNQKSSLFLYDLAYFSLFSCNLWPFQPVWRVNIQNFWRFAQRETRFHNFGHFSPPENREEISVFASRGGGQIRVFGQNSYPCYWQHSGSFPAEFQTLTGRPLLAAFETLLDALRIFLAAFWTLFTQKCFCFKNLAVFWTVIFFKPFIKGSETLPVRVRNAANRVRNAASKDRTTAKGGGPLLAAIWILLAAFRTL